MLASVDKRTRDRGVSVLIRWLTGKAEVQEEDLKKIWKGLFYCMWHSDKAPVQADLATSLAGIVEALAPANGVLFFRVFLLTMRREWAGIDRLRMDKFYVLVRKFVASAFSTLAKHKFDDSLIQQFMKCFKDGTLMSSDNHAAMGINLHLADIYLQELQRCPSVPANKIPELFEPFADTLARTPDKSLLRRVQEGVFHTLLGLRQDAVVAKAGRSEEKVGNSVSEVKQSLPPWALEADFAALDEKLFDLATMSGIAGRNRVVLYEVHERFKKAGCAKGASDKWPRLKGDAHGANGLQNGVAADPSAAAPSGEASASAKEGVGHADAEEKGSGKKKRKADLKGTGIEEDGKKVKQVKLKKVKEVSQEVPAEAGSADSRKKAKKSKLQGAAEKDSLNLLANAKEHEPAEEPADEEPLTGNLDQLFESVGPGGTPAAAPRKRKAPTVAQLAALAASPPASRTRQRKQGGKVVETQPPPHMGPHGETPAFVGETTLLTHPHSAQADAGPEAVGAVAKNKKAKGGKKAAAEQGHKEGGGTAPTLEALQAGEAVAAPLAKKQKGGHGAGSSEQPLTPMKSSGGGGGVMGSPMSAASDGDAGASPGVTSKKAAGLLRGSQSEPPKRKKKKVRFSLKDNLEFQKNGPVPPVVLRTPPSATPRGSALKVGVKPGPIDKKQLKAANARVVKLEAESLHGAGGSRSRPSIQRVNGKGPTKRSARIPRRAQIVSMI
eukprot:jgi/Mesen1/11010/ME000098S10409